MDEPFITNTDWIWQSYLGICLTALVLVLLYLYFAGYSSRRLVRRRYKRYEQSLWSAVQRRIHHPPAVDPAQDKIRQSI